MTRAELNGFRCEANEIILLLHAKKRPEQIKILLQTCILALKELEPETYAETIQKFMVRTLPKL